jgi:hypothetical protein
MPFFGLTKRSKQIGIQTHAKAIKLPEPLREAELEYLSVRDHYMQIVGLKAQYEEALAQAKAEGRKADADMFGKKIYGITSSLTDRRQRVKSIGEKSYAEAFHLAATMMLPKEIQMALETEAEKLLGRPRHELARTD